MIVALTAPTLTVVPNISQSSSTICRRESRRGRRPPVGSGKLETPCDRMQDANSSVLLLLASELWPADVLVAVPLELDEPHAARPRAAASRPMMIVTRMGASLRFGLASKCYEIGGNRLR
jgi:hypothetical protein